MTDMLSVRVMWHANQVQYVELQEDHTFRLNGGYAQCTGSTAREPGTVRGTARRPHFSLTIISVTV